MSRIVMPEGCLHKAETFSFHASHSVLLETFEFWQELSYRFPGFAGFVGAGVFSAVLGSS